VKAVNLNADASCPFCIGYGLVTMSWPLENPFKRTACLRCGLSADLGHVLRHPHVSPLGSRKSCEGFLLAYSKEEIDRAAEDIQEIERHLR
jgi:hypothetical protein